MRFIIFLTLILKASAFAESYSDYSERINSERHVLRLGETISTVLKEKGYKKIFKKGSYVDQTLWKNGILKKDLNNLPVGKEILIPYKKIDKKTIRKIASSEKEIIPEVLISKPMATLGLALGSGFFTVSSQDSNSLEGRIDSSSYSLAKLSFTQFWNGFDSYFYLGANIIKLDEAEDISLSKTNFSVPSFGAGFKVDLLHFVKLNLSVNRSPIIFPTENTGTEMVVTSGQLQNYDIGFGFQIAQYKKLKASLNLDYTYIPSQKLSDIKVESGNGFKASLQSLYQGKSIEVVGEAFFDSKVVEREIARDTQTTFGVLLGVNYLWD